MKDYYKKVPTSQPTLNTRFLNILLYLTNIRFMQIPRRLIIKSKALFVLTGGIVSSLVEPSKEKDVKSFYSAQDKWSTQPHITTVFLVCLILYLLPQWRTPRTPSGCHGRCEQTRRPRSLRWGWRRSVRLGLQSEGSWEPAAGRRAESWQHKVTQVLKGQLDTWTLDIVWKDFTKYICSLKLSQRHKQTFQLTDKL